MQLLMDWWLIDTDDAGLLALADAVTAGQLAGARVFREPEQRFGVSGADPWFATGSGTRLRLEADPAAALRGVGRSGRSRAR
jgi:hypothetical protein